MKLETERLEIIALTPEQFNMWINNISQLENELNCSYQAEPMEGFFLDIVKKQAEITNSNSHEYLWYSFWFIIRKLDRIVIGSADFKNAPNKNGEVEIGYGLEKSFEHNGYMTETVMAMCNWALQQNSVHNVIAETETDSFASQNILKKCGFKLYRQSKTLWWKL